jgi:hypothetical protein
MNDVTLCLVTKGRSEYLVKLLDSFSEIGKYGHVNFLIILNGAAPDIVDEFIKWSENFEEKVTLRIFADNDARISSYWPDILDVKTEWIIFPSDDDYLKPNFFENWISFVSDFSQCDVIASSLDLIDSRGKKLGIRKSPSFSSTIPFTESAARAFSECPFLWPGLIVRVENLPPSIPPSRYVFDWWIGLYLIFTSKIMTTLDSYTWYRVHDTQESNVASMARKNLEALTHLGAFIQSTVFSNWINSCSILDIIDFLKLLRKYPPVYGDSNFSAEFVSILTQKIKSIRKEDEIQKFTLFTNALAHNVLLNNFQLKHLNQKRIAIQEFRQEYNFFVEFDLLACHKVLMLQASKTDEVDESPIVRVGCNHTRSTRSDIYLSCDTECDLDTLRDSLLYLAEEFLREQNVFQKNISPFEFWVIKLLRRTKKLLPFWLNKFLYRIVSDRR